MAGVREDADVRLAWLAARFDRARGWPPAQALQELTEALATATGEAVTVRRLADGGTALPAVAVHHPDAVVRAAMQEVTAATIETRESGLWRVLLDEGRAVVFTVPRDGPGPVAASAEQQRFLTRWPVRAVAGAPVRQGGVLIGGVSLVRFVDERPFTDADLALLEHFAAWVAPVVAGLG